jgi:putative hemolysin
VLWEIAVLFLLILLNAFFAMSELAIVSARRPRLVNLVEDGRRGARRALALHDNPNRFLSTVQVGITLIGILAGAYSGARVATSLKAILIENAVSSELAEPLAFGAVVLATTYLSLIIGELVPKQVALNNAEAIASAVAPPMTWLSRIAAPVVWFLEVSTRMVLNLLRLPTKRKSTVTEEEVKTMIAEGTEAGVFAAAERDMIDGVLKLADRPVRSIMTPRFDVVWLDPTDPPEEIHKRIAESGHSRFPVGRGSVEAIEGVVRAKDLLDQVMAGKPFDLTACIRLPTFVHDGASILKLLEVFRASPLHMAIVVDEYGVFEGLVTPSDILAAIAGAFPQIDEGEEPQAVQREDGSWLLDGMMPVDEVEKLLMRKGMAGEGDYHTLAGFMLWQLGHLPHTGEHFDWNGLSFEVVDMDGRRIDRVLVSEIQPSDPPERED